MENTPTTVQRTAEDQKLVNKKRETWAQMGETCHDTEAILNLRAQKAAGKIKIPQTFAEVKEAETLLAEVKAERSAIDEARKPITRVFDAVAARLMNPAKTLEEPIKNCEVAIIKLKKIEEGRIQLENSKAAERNQVKTNTLVYMNEKEAGLRKLIEAAIAKEYELALGPWDVKPAELDEHLAEVIKKFDKATLTATPPKYFAARIPQQEVDEIIASAFIIDAESLFNEFVNGLNNKFADYEVAYANKGTALQLSKEQTDARTKEIDTTANNKDIAAKLESAATPVTTVSSGVKPLKKLYAVEMPETPESAFAILAACAANIDKCMPKLRVTKWFSFNATQAAAALSKVKCDDNTFQPEGIIFKEVDKL